MASTIAPYYGPPRGGYQGQSNQGYGYGPQSRGQSPLAMALMQIIQNKQQQTMADPLPEADAQSYYESDYLAPYLEGLTPLGRFTDMGMRDQAARTNAMAAARAAATEKSRLQQIMSEIRRTRNAGGPIESIESTMPNGNVMVEAQTSPENFGVASAPIPDRTLLSPTGQVIGSATYGPSNVPFTVGGLDGSEFFQREANANGANKYAQPEAGYQGRPLTAGSKDWNSWEKATSMIRRSKK